MSRPQHVRSEAILRWPRRLIPCGILALAAMASTLLPIAPARADTLDETAPLRAAVTAQGVFRHLDRLAAIAAENGGNRAAGTPGYEASAEYVAETLRAAGYQVTEQTFDYPFFEELAPPSLEPVGHGPRIGPARSLQGSGSGRVEAPLWPVDLGLEPGVPPGVGSSGCETEDFAGMPRGSIALVRRGLCPFRTKVANAVEAGAAAVVIVNSGRGRQDGSFSGDLGGPVAVPALAIDFTSGRRLAEAGPVRFRLESHTRAGTRQSRNLLAELPVGDPDRVVIVGAHLDSVPAGPGLNDNASGVAVILETALRLAEAGPHPANRLRFAFWGAEELGLLGSRHYLDSLSASDRQRLVAALNFDMVGSPNYGRFVYDGDGSEGGRPGPPGSGRIERIFQDYFARLELPAKALELDGGSDHASFAAHGIAVGGLYAGSGEIKSARSQDRFGGVAGKRYDGCYHQPCDTLANISRAAIDELADAAAHGILSLALDPGAGT